MWSLDSLFPDFNGALNPINEEYVFAFFKYFTDGVYNPVKWEYLIAVSLVFNWSLNSN